MLEVLLNAVLPIFSVAALGYFYSKRGILGTELALHLNRFVFYFALPVLLFRLLSGVEFQQLNLNLILAYFLAELALYVAGYFVARVGFKREKLESLLIGMTAGFVNHVFFVLPIAQQLFGEAAIAPIVTIITLDAVAFFGGTIVILEIATNRGNGLSLTGLLRKFATNPQLVGIFFGALAMAFGVRLSGGFAVFAQFVGDAAAPASLFALGIVLASQKFSNFTLAAVFTGLKLLIMPLVSWVLLVWVFDVASDWANPGLLVAAGPSGAMAFVLALQYKIPVFTIATIILLTTIGSVAAITLISQLL